MYGPPPDPRQVLAPVDVIDDPWSYLICFGVGAALTLVSLWRRPPESVRALLFVLGQTIVLTAPLAAHLDTYVYGAFPTIDKEGSLLFFLDGVHRRMLLHPFMSPGDPAARLIGVHVGHLWVTEAFALVLSPIGAFNIQGLLYPALAWWSAWLLFRELCGNARVAMLLGFAWGMGLHVFRDLNWYTIEKAAIFWLALFAWALLRAWRDGGRWRAIAGVLFLLMSWMNLYLGLVGAFVGALALAGAAWDAAHRRVRTPGLRNLVAACVACTAFALPLFAWQWFLMSGSQASLGSPEQFLWQRAALDSFTLVPLLWNRLEVHRALNLVGLGLALFGTVREWRSDGRVRFAALAATFLFLLSMGPQLLPGPVENPVYFAVRAVVPGFWRMAKPEVFFHASWLLLLGIAAIHLQRRAPSAKGTGLLYLLFLVGWVLMVRTHPAYPSMTLPVQSKLAPNWQERVFDTPK